MGNACMTMSPPSWSECRLSATEPNWSQGTTSRRAMAPCAHWASPPQRTNSSRRRSRGYWKLSTSKTFLQAAMATGRRLGHEMRYETSRVTCNLARMALWWKRRQGDTRAVTHVKPDAPRATGPEADTLADVAGQEKAA